MKSVKVRDKAWAYTLFELEGTYVLSVLCGSSAMYFLNIPLTKAESERALSDGAFLDELAKQITTDPHSFAPRSIQLEGQ